jgi:UDP-glucuronate 4-epimerase
MSQAGNILVTGAAGFIGSTLVDRLLAEGRRVVGLDSFDPFYAERQKRRNLVGALDHADFELVEGDIRDRSLVERILGRGFDAVVHLAALAGVRPSLEQPTEYADVNVVGTSVLLDAAVRHGGPAFVFASSSSVYGERSEGPFREDDRVDHPISPYAATKKAGELVAHSFHHAHALPVRCLRFFTAYGPRQRPDLAVHKFARCMRRGEPIPVYGDGSAQRDFTYIDDIVAGVVGAIDTRSPWTVLNLGAGRTITVMEMIETLGAALGCVPEIDFQPRQTGDVSKTWADIEAARSTIGYAPSMPFAEGVERFVAWLDGEQNGEQQ